MRMDDQRESGNVEDVRGAGGFRPVHGIGLGTIAVALIAGWIFGINPLTVLGILSGGSSPQVVSTDTSAPAVGTDSNDPQMKFVSQVLASTEDVWSGVFQQAGRTYEDPKLRVFRDSYPTACGMGQAAAGPFYCPRDRIVY